MIKVDIERDFKLTVNWRILLKVGLIIGIGAGMSFLFTVSTLLLIVGMVSK